MSWYRDIASLVTGRRNRHVAVIQGGSRRPSSVTSEQARTNGTVASCVDQCARAIAQLKFVAPDLPTTHPVNRLLRRPNDYQTGYDFLHGLVEDTLYEGNAVIRIVRGLSRNGQVGNPMVMAPAAPESVRIEPDALGRPQYHITGQTDLIPASDIIHVRDGSGHEAWARSRISKGGGRIRALIAADNLMHDAFDGGLRASYWVESEDALGKDGGKSFTDALSAAFGPDGDRRGGVAILHKKKLHQLAGVKPADTDLRALRQDLIRELAGLFSVPPFRVGGTGDTKYSNFTASMLVFYRDTIIPLVENIIQRYELAFGTRITCDTTDLISGDLKTQLDMALRGSGGPVLTPNEGRVLSGRERVEGDPEMDRVHHERSDPGNSLEEQPRAGETPTDDGGTDAEGENQNAA